MIPILIRKDPNKYENIPHNADDFQSVINGVDLFDITNYIISAIDGDWAPSYWKCNSINDEILSSGLHWLIYSYLVHSKLLVIEDRFFGYNGDRADKYKNRLTYHNTFEVDLYKPIDRMFNEGYLNISKISPFSDLYKLGPMYWRNTNLEKLL